MAVSRPEPGPLRPRRPCGRRAPWPGGRTARPPSGRRTACDLREPLKPTLPAEAHESTLPSWSVINGQAGLRELVVRRAPRADRHGRGQRGARRRRRRGHASSSYTVWPNGARIERGDEKAPIPADLAPDELTPEMAEELLAKGAAGRATSAPIPRPGSTVLALTGRFGPFVQLGEQERGLEGEAEAGVAVRVDGPRHGHARGGAAAARRCPASSAPTPRARRSPRRTGATGRTSSKGTDSRSLGSRGPALHRDARRGGGDVRPAQAAARPRGEAAARRSRRAPRVGRAGAGARRPLRPYVTDGTTNASVPRGVRPEVGDARASGRACCAERAPRVAAEEGEEGAAKRTAKKTTARRRPRRRSSAAKKAPAKKATAKKAPAKRATQRRRSTPRPGRSRVVAADARGASLERPGRRSSPPTRRSRRCPPRRGGSSAAKTFFRLWIAQFVSSLGDWIGLIAILAIAARVSNNSGAAVSLVMVHACLPGFFLGTVGGVIIDRFDRRKVMVLCDIGRASLLVLAPVRREPARPRARLARARGPHAAVGPGAGRDRAEPRRRRAASSANSLSLAASYGTFPIASIIFSLLAGVATVHRRLRRHLVVQGRPGGARARVRRDDVPRVGGDRLPTADPATRKRADDRRIDWTETFREIKEGLQFVGQHPLVRGVMLGLGFGLIGAGAMIPLGPSFAQEVLNGGARGVRRVDDRARVRRCVRRRHAAVVAGTPAAHHRVRFAVIGAGAFLVLAASFSRCAPAALMIGGVGACAGTAVRHRLHRVAGERARRARAAARSPRSTPSCGCAC